MTIHPHPQLLTIINIYSFIVPVGQASRYGFSWVPQTQGLPRVCGQPVCWNMVTPTPTGAEGFKFTHNCRSQAEDLQALLASAPQYALWYLPSTAPNMAACFL